MKILVIDDDFQILEMVEMALKREGYEVDTADDGEVGYQKATENKYDVILTDIMLPKKSGFDLIADVRSRGIDTPILVVSARVMVGDRVKGLELGADDYLTKSFSLDELLARVKSLIRRGPAKSKAPESLQCGELTINFDGKKVTREGREINLTEEEFNILAELMRSKNNVVTHDHLMEHVWKKDSLTTLESVIQNLHKKIDSSESGVFTKSVMVHRVGDYGYLLTDAEVH